MNIQAINKFSGKCIFVRVVLLEDGEECVFKWDVQNTPL